MRTGKTILVGGEVMKTAKKRNIENIFIVTVLLSMLLVLTPSKLMMGKDSESDDSGVVFKDDFSAPSPISRWPRIRPAQNDEKNVVESANGVYRMYNPSSEKESLLALAPQPATIRDASIEVDATRTGDDSGEPASWGVICRESKSRKENAYSLGILNNGSPFIAKLKNGEASILAVDAPADAINKDTSTNHIRGDCIGSKLTLYVNDQELLEAEDTEFASGRVGLTVESTDISFDNFLVSKP
jgi:hypothetical protein